jgi:putative protease
MGNKNKIELLAPAGDIACFIAAVNAGADAVYFGLKEFNMRDTARNFSLNDLKELGKYKVKKYLTLNTVIYDSEIAKIEKLIKKIKGKVDAIICWDLSVINLCRKYKIPFHISTQASISNSKSAEFYKKLGAERIILARELNLTQIKKISKIIDVECFIHGAMCVAESGRCFTSQFLHNRSANRGKCQHPCRKEYKIIDDEGNELKVQNRFILSAKDLCTLPFIEKLKKAGIKAFKIEGRNRDADYVDTVVRVYREAVDNKLSEKRRKELLKKLECVYNRKFSSGFFIKYPTSDDFTDINGSNAKEIKKIIGKVTNYLSDKKILIMKIFTDTINLGDEIYIIGNKTGIVRVKIESMEQHKKSVKTANKGELVAVFCKEKVRENDTVYKIIKKK